MAVSIGGGAGRRGIRYGRGIGGRGFARAVGARARAGAGLAALVGLLGRVARRLRTRRGRGCRLARGGRRQRRRPLPSQVLAQYLIVVARSSIARVKGKCLAQQAHRLGYLALLRQKHSQLLPSRAANGRRHCRCQEPAIASTGCRELTRLHLRLGQVEEQGRRGATAPRQRHSLLVVVYRFGGLPAPGGG